MKPRGMGTALPPKPGFSDSQTSRLTLTATPRKVGQPAQRDGTAEAVVVAFPKTGVISYSPHWLDPKRAAGCNRDNSLIVNDFRRFCRDRNITLDTRNIEKIFSDYCAKVGQI